MPDPTEIDVALDQIARGDRDAFRKIVRAYSLPLRSYLAGQVHYMNDVDDLVQEVFITAYRNLSTFRRGQDFGVWLRGIARNKLYHHWRSTARGNRALERFREELARVVESDLDRAHSVDDSGAIEMLLHCIARLPDRLRRVVRGGLDGDKPATLADELTTSVEAIYNMHYRANQLLRKCLQKEMG